MSYSRALRVGKWLDCGCCGTGFQIWEGYEDQDQDNGYGICQSCQGSIEEDNEREYDKVINCLRDGLNDENKTKLDAMTRDEQKMIAWQALNDGTIKFSLVRAS